MGPNEFRFGKDDSIEVICADHSVGPPFHADGNRVLEDFAAGNHAAVKDSGVFVELPPAEVVTDAGVLCSFNSTLEQPNASTAEIMMEGVR